MKNVLRIGLPVLLASAGLITTLSANAQLKGSLTVQVDGLNNQQGTLCYKLFTGSQGFPNGDEKALKRNCVKITEQPLILTFKNLAAGSYAIAVFHDKNGDRKLNRNAAGMPTEGYGFSNNPVIRQGPPKFGQAVFLVAGPTTEIKIEMKYSSGG